MLTQPTQQSRWAGFKLKSGRSPIKLILFALLFIALINVALVVFINLDQFANIVADTPNAHTSEPELEPQPVYPIATPEVWRQPAVDSCDMQFGNGFNETMMCTSTGFSCYFNPEIVATNCVAQSLVIHPSKIKVSIGNETIESVRWREEPPEFPVYSPGAFSVGCEADAAIRSTIARGNEKYRDHLAPMLQSFEYGQPIDKCDVTIDQALLLTRYEYANVYHTLTDLYNTYQAANMLGKITFSSSDITVIFLDGHSQGAMDEYWTTLFTPSIRYIKQFPEGDNICVKHAVFVAPGYGSTLSPGMFRADTLRCRNHPCMNDFAKFVQTQFRLDEPFVFETRDAYDNHVVIDSSSKEPIISFATRRPYLSHPRVRLDSTERLLVGEQEAVQSTAFQLKGTARFYAWDFTRMSLRDQLRVLYASRVVMGVHGAALGHILYMKPSTVLVELVPPEYASRTHFRYFAAWSGHEYGRVDLETARGHGYTLIADPLVNACRQALRTTVH